MCLICLHEIDTGKMLSCGHIFHHSCIKSWIQGNANQFCPKCKTPISVSDNPEEVQRLKQLLAQETERVHNFPMENYSISRMNFILLSNYSGRSPNIRNHKEELFEFNSKDIEYLSKGQAFSYSIPKEAPSFRTPEISRLKFEMSNSVYKAFVNKEEKFMPFYKDHINGRILEENSESEIAE